MNAPGAPRLIHRVDVLQQLLAAVAAVPAGVKLSVPQLRDALVSQADVLAGLQTLVLAGELDASTLRPVRVPTDPSVAGETSRSGFKRGQGLDNEAALPLFDALVAEGARRRMSVEAVSLGVWGNKARIYRLRNVATVQRKTAERVRAWLAASEASRMEPVTAPEPPVIKIPLGRKSRSYCRQPTACVAGPKGPCRICHAKKAEAPQRRDPTQKPDTPLMDLADRQRLNGQRHHASIRRGQEREATALLDQGVDPSKVKSTFQANTMRQVQDRRDREARDADPVERAKLALQRKGLVVYSAIVSGGRKDRYIVSGQQNQLTPAELIDLAERKTGQSFRRVA